MALTQDEIAYVQRLRQAGADDENVLFYLEKRRKDEGVMNQPQKKGVVEAVGDRALGIGQGIVTGALRGVGNIANIAGEVLDTPLPGRSIARLGDMAQSGTEKASQFLEKTADLDTKLVPKVAEFGTQLYGGGQLLKGLSKGTQLATQVLNKNKTFSSLAPYADKFSGFVGKSPLATKTLQAAQTGATTGAAFQAVSEGQVTPGFVGASAAIGGAFPIAGGVLKKGKDFVGKTVPASLQLQGLMNPAKLAKAKNEILKEGMKTPDDVAQWMMDRNIKGNKESIITKLLDRSKSSRQAVDDSLATIKTRVKSTEAKKALQQTYDDLKNVAGMEKSALEVKKLLKQTDYSLSELNKTKRILDKQYNLYTKAGGETAGTKAEGLRNIRIQIRELIEDQAEKAGIKNIRALNNETQVSRTLADAIARKSDADGVRELLTAFAPSGVGGIIGATAGPFDGSSVEGKVGNILFGMTAGKIAGSTTFKTNLANLIYKGLNKKQLGALDKFLQSGGTTSLSDDIANKIDDALDLTSQSTATVGTVPQEAKRYITLPNAGTKKAGQMTGQQGLKQSLDDVPVGLTSQSTLPQVGEKIVPGMKVSTPTNTPKATKVKTGMKSQRGNMQVGKVDDLVSEAKKYKSADEFIEAQPSIFRAGELRDGAKKALQGDYFATTKKYANSYSDRGDVKEYFFDNGAKILKERDLPRNLSLGNGSVIDAKELLDMGGIGGLQNKAFKYAQKNGYDAFYWSDNELNIINRDILKTKSQLTEIWNKANKK